MAHHGGARDLAERADVGQARRAVAGLEQDFACAGALDAGQQLARFLERPGLAGQRLGAQGRIDRAGNQRGRLSHHRAIVQVIR
jgi:hypothetical protein